MNLVNQYTDEVVHLDTYSTNLKPNLCICKVLSLLFIYFFKKYTGLSSDYLLMLKECTSGIGEVN